jgi:hypothetical protein
LSREIAPRIVVDEAVRFGRLAALSYAARCLEEEPVRAVSRNDG